jgi:CRP-like cAMP-binding protein
MLGTMIQVRFKAGDMLMTEGEEADGAYIIEEGEVEIVVKRNFTEIVYATVGPGDIVGEMALIDNEPRSASVRAVTEVVCQFVPARDFHAEMEQSPTMMRFVTAVLVRNLRRMVAPKLAKKR